MDRSIPRACSLVILISVLVTPLSVFAADHQICYQVPPLVGHHEIIGRFACRTDGGGPQGCSVDQPAGSTNFSHAATSPTADEAEGEFSAGGTITSTFHFADGTVRTCTLNLTATDDPLSRFRYVIGYTTDESGLVTTAIWTKTSDLPSDPAQLDVLPAPDFVVVGGGAAGAASPNGFLLWQSELGTLAGHPTGVWYAAARSNIPPQASTVTAYVIGMKIEGISFMDLALMVTTDYGYSGTSTHPTVIAVPNAPTLAAIGGGVGPNGTFVNQYLTATFPNVQQCFRCGQLVKGWTVASTDHVLASQGQITSQIISVPRALSIAGNPFHVETRVVSAASTISPSPSAAVFLPSGFALTGVGAQTNVQPWSGITLRRPNAGNLLWSIAPIPGGAAVAATEQFLPSLASVSAFAVGMKLVPGSMSTPINVKVGR